MIVELKIGRIKKIPMHEIIVCKWCEYEFNKKTHWLVKNNNEKKKYGKIISLFLHSRITWTHFFSFLFYTYNNNIS